MPPSDAPRGDALPLSPERWARVRGLVEESIALPHDRRSAFLEASCGGDAELRGRVERLVLACERADESWAFLLRPAGEIAVPLLASHGAPRADPASRAQEPPAALCAALEGRYAVGAELGRGGMATVYAAEDLRHQRRVAIKVLDPQVGALLGAERFLSEIRVTARLQHTNLLPLFDSGEAGGLLYYVMPLIDGGTLRARLLSERQLPVHEGVELVRAIAGALDYAHRQGVVHRDLKPENILLHDGQPLVADFGISRALTSSDSSRTTAAGISLGTPRYMSPEQAAIDPDVDGRSDIYSLACVLYELLVGEPPFKGSSVEVLRAKVLGDPPPPARSLRQSVPAHVDAALTRALAKLPGDRYGTAREFADALMQAAPADAGGGVSLVTPPARPAEGVRRHPRARVLVGAGATIGLALAGSWMLREPTQPAEVTQFVYKELIERTQFSSATLTPDGRAMVYTGADEASSPIMVWRLDQGESARGIPGTEGGINPRVAPDGRRLLFFTVDERNATVPIDGVRATRASKAWRYGSAAWVGDSAFVAPSRTRGLVRRRLMDGSQVELTRIDSAQGETRHMDPLILPGALDMVFTVSNRSGPAVAIGTLAIASLDRGSSSLVPHTVLDIAARQAIAYVDGWLLYTRADGRAIMAVQLDVQRRQTSGDAVQVLLDAEGNLETASLADNGTLLYVRHPRVNSAVLVNADGVMRPGLTNPEGSFMHPRLSPDGQRLAVQVTSARGEDLWLYDLPSRTAMQLTTDGKGLNPSWTPDGRRLVFTKAREGLMLLAADGSAAAEMIPGTEEAFGPTVTPDGESVVFQMRTDNGWSIWSASLSGESPPRRLVDDPVSVSMPVVSPDGQWLAYAVSVGGENEVWARPYLRAGDAVQVSQGGGTEPAWSPHGDRIYYRAGGALMAANVSAPGLTITARRPQFAGDFDATMPHRNYDVSADGTEFVMIAPYAAGKPEAVLLVGWLAKLREQLAAGR